MPVRQAVWLQRKGAYRSAAAQAFIAVLQQQGVTPTHSSAASSPADAPARSRGKSAS
jgi:LysR family cyn operon transcriptional activator